MIVLIAGASHTGKTLLAQKLLEKYKFPYLSIDHLKMGLIRSNNTFLTPTSKDEELTNYLWPIVVEMIKTAIENNQNLIVEGCYIPFDYKKYFDENYIDKIKYYCLIMSENYIKNNYNKIIKNSNVIEKRLDDDLDIKNLISDNHEALKLAKKYNVNYILIDKNYDIQIDLFK